MSLRAALSACCLLAFCAAVAAQPAANGDGRAKAAAPAPQAPTPPSKAEPKSEWVFSILPKAFQKNPLLDLTVITEMTEAGRRLPPVSAEHPAYFEAHSSGFRQLGDAPSGEKTLKAEDIEKLLVRALATNGFRPATPEHPASVLIFYTWGSHNRKEEGDAENPALGGTAIALNILDRAALVGGERFAEQLSRLFIEADTFEQASQSLPPEVRAFANPVAMFRRGSPRNEQMLDHTANDVYFVVASAYDYKLASANRRVLLWRTRMTVAAQGVSQEQTLPTLVLAAGPYFGQDMPESALLTKRTREGTVEIGTPVVVPTPAAPAPAQKK